MPITSQDKLSEYRAKRNFELTQEPEGGQHETSPQPIFVVQKHAARALHYDFRLEVDGVLKSWAVPKGPSSRAGVRRLAAPTEDHPMEYADFEGVIPEGEYGAGAMIVWDRGVYRNLRADKQEGVADMLESLEQSVVEIWLEGQKLRGGYALIRTGKAADARWLLIKKKDETASAGPELTETEPRSALSGRTLAEVAEGAKAE